MNSEIPIVSGTGESRTLTRRAFVGELIGLGGLLAACGSKNASDSGNAQSGTAAPTAANPAYARASLLVEAKPLAGDLSKVRAIALMPANDFAAGHIDGSAQIDWPDLNIADTSTDTALQTWQQQVAQKLGALGLTTSEQVVAYDSGTLFAARLWWVLAYLGQRQTQVLNGGLPAWKNSGQATTTVTKPTPSTSYHGSADPSVLATLNDVRDALKQPNVVFLDARSPGEYAAGHIPGAVNITYTENATGGPIPLWKPQDVLLKMYKAAGVSADKTIIPYCSTGVRSAVTYFTLRLIGYDKVQLFTGSWAEWSAHPELPVEKGTP